VPFLRIYARSPLVRRIANSAMGGSQAGGTALARIKPGVRVEDIRLGPLGYAAAARQSYAQFSRLKKDGVIPQSTRFQVALPTPLAVLDFFSRADQARLGPLYEERMLDEMREIVAAIPAQDLAIQWDTAVEFAMLEGIWPSPFGTPEQAREPIVDLLVRIGNAVPSDVELGYHLCYGDAAHKHFVEPADTSQLAFIARGILRGVARPVNWLHFPVPRQRTDAAYFEPMRAVDIPSATELYVGLLHLDSAANNQARIATAQRTLERTFGVATECGLGRSMPDTVPALLRLHTDFAAPANVTPV